MILLRSASYHIVEECLKSYCSFSCIRDYFILFNIFIHISLYSLAQRHFLSPTHRHYTLYRVSHQNTVTTFFYQFLISSARRGSVVLFTASLHQKCNIHLFYLQGSQLSRINLFFFLAPCSTDSTGLTHLHCTAHNSTTVHNT